MLPALISGCAQLPGELSSAAVPGVVTDMATAKAIHASALVLDAHADIEYAAKPSRYAGPDGVSQVAPAKLQLGGVDAVVMAVAVGPGPRDEAGYAAARKIATDKIAEVYALADDPLNNVIVPRTADELVAAHEAGKTALLLGFQNARILGEDVNYLDELYSEGVRVFALTHMGHNDFADSSRPLYDGDTSSYEPDAEHGGLSDLGRAAIARLNALGGVIDVSQLSRPATIQVLSQTTAPIIASHSNVQALSNVRRNLSDEEIELIGTNGGVIHISAFKGYLFDSNNAQLDADIRAARFVAGIEEDYDYPFELYWEMTDPDRQRTFLSTVSGLLGPGSVDDMLNHIDYVVQRIGVDHVGIGNDFNHGSGIEGYKDASEALNITIGLLGRGYSAEAVEKIWGGNFLRVMRGAEQAANH